MAVDVVVLRESAAGERRVALTPETCRKLIAAGATVHLQHGAGASAYFPDADYAGAHLFEEPSAVLAAADLLLCVQPPPVPVLSTLRSGAAIVGLLAPQADPQRVEAFNARQLTAFPLERLPRTTRAQAMDVLSSQAGMAGYKAMLLAAQTAPRFFPMLTTAAGTIRPSKVLVIGAGVAGLQAIATARRLGAQVEGFDVRPETREQIQSLGARFLDLGVSAVGEGGYARELTAEERAEQQRRLGEHLKTVDVVVTTAAVPGRPAPKIVSAAMVGGMRAGSVLIDLPAESGGNCELTRPGETVDAGGVSIVGPLHLASAGALHASEMYARNVFNFVQLLLKKADAPLPSAVAATGGGARPVAAAAAPAPDGAIALQLDWDDELIARTCFCHAGQVRG